MPGYATQAGDCLDAEATPENRANLVNPGVTDFFGVGYLTPAGESFDYDCDGQEEADPNQSGRTGSLDCSQEVFLEGCNSDAVYLPTERSGLGVSPICGSDVLALCNPVASSRECVQQNLPTSNPLRCR
jgi:hypothetical protein